MVLQGKKTHTGALFAELFYYTPNAFLQNSDISQTNFKCNTC